MLFLITISATMTPVAVDASGRMANGFSEHKVDTMNPHDLVQFDKSLTPIKYEIKGTNPDSKILLASLAVRAPILFMVTCTSKASASNMWASY